MPTDKLSGLNPLKHRSYPHEILDEGNHPPEHLYGTFEDMRRVNTLLGGNRISLAGLTRLTGHLRSGDSLSILDIGTGHADIPRAVMHWAAERDLRCEAIGLDIDLATLKTAGTLPPNRSIDFIQGSMLELPIADNSIDVAMSSMTLHHLSDDDAVVALREMARVSKLGIIVNDLSRTPHGYAVAWMLGRIATSNPLTRHDAHRSIQRGRTEPELASLAREAGLNAPVFDSALWYRIAMTIGVREW
ncbi:MAG: methyltransferase domain-containing protein [Sphaerobacteraceae bacterium]|nr:MAG: methyltransferase domain-containing protein [Sphaerobacteraceae bacterium]